MWNIDRAVSRKRMLCLVVVAVLTSTSCEDKPINMVTGIREPTLTAPRRVIGVAELTFHDITTANITATATLAATVADLERIRSTPGARSTLDVIQVDAIVNGMFTYTPRDSAPSRFLRATFGVRNTRANDIVFDVLRENLSFVPVSTVLTLPNSPIRSFEGTAASEVLAKQIAPTQLMAVDGDGKLVTVESDVLQTLNDAQSRATSLPTDAVALFRYAFSVKRLAIAPFDGGVTVGFRVPLAPRPADNPTALSILFLIVDDTGAQPH